MINAAMVVFCVSMVALVYTQFGYLASLVVVSKLIRRPEKREPIRPLVSLIIPVHNGAGLILRKIENLRTLDYPPEMMEIIIVDDCSTDRTTAEISSARILSSSRILSLSKDVTPGIRLICLDRRSGKSAALNAGLKVATGEVIGFTDVAAMLEPDALTLAIERFADPKVGCVSSEDKVIADGGVGESEGLYTNIDALARRLEGAICSATGMSGSFYLVRRELCPPFPLDVATDMFSALHCVAKGYRAVVESCSKVRIAAQPDAAREFERKVRTMVTGLRALRGFIYMLNPYRYGLYSLFLLSHKLLRYLTPVFTITAIASTAYLSSSSTTFMWLLWAELTAILIGVLQIGVQSWVTNARVAGKPAFYCAAIAAAAVGWYRYFRGESYRTWQPTERRSA